MFILIKIDSILKHRFKKSKKSQKNLLFILRYDLKLELVIEDVVSFRQGKDVANSKDYSVIIHLISIVNVCCRL